MSRDDAFRAQSLLSTAEGALADAALSLTFFEACRVAPHGPKRWEQRRAREQELRARVSAKYESQLVWSFALWRWLGGSPQPGDRFVQRVSSSKISRERRSSSLTRARSLRAFSNQAS